MKRVGHTSEIPFGIYYWKTGKIRILKKWKKIAGDNIISHMCTKNHNHMKYCSWDTEWDKFVLSFWAIFCPSPTGDVIILNLCTTNNDHLMYGSWDIKCGRHFFFFVILGYFLPFYPAPFPLTAQNIKILKKARKLLEIFYLSTMNKNQKSNDVYIYTRIYHHFTLVYHKSWSCAILFLRYGKWHM